MARPTVPSRHARPTLSATTTPIRGASSWPGSERPPVSVPGPVPPAAPQGASIARPDASRVPAPGLVLADAVASFAGVFTRRGGGVRPRGGRVLHAGFKRGAQAVGGGVRVLGKQQQVVVLLVVLDIRHVRARVREDDSVAGLDDEDSGHRSQHLDRLSEDDLDRPRVLVRAGGEHERPRRWGDVGKPDDAPLRLRHDLLRDHHHVALPQHLARPCDRLRKQRAKIVSGPKPGERSRSPGPATPRGSCRPRGRWEPDESLGHHGKPNQISCKGSGGYHRIPGSAGILARVRLGPARRPRPGTAV